MHVNQHRLAEEIAEIGRSLFARGLTHGTSGNISVRCGTGFLMTPTGVSLGDIEPQTMSLLDDQGRHVAGGLPTKEWPLHLALYRARPKAGAVIHLHACHSTAVSCMADVNSDNVLPPLTAYYVMRVGSMPLLGFYPPGDPEMAEAVGRYGREAHAMLLANHGPIVAGSDLADALANIEEVEATARLVLLLHGHKTRPLGADKVAALNATFGRAGANS